MQRASGNGGDDHDARRERHRHRRARRPGAGARARPTRASTGSRAPRCSRPRRRTARSQLARVAGAPLYFVHLSAAEALAEVAAARDRGQNVFAETCPQYLFLSDEDLAREGFEGAKYVCSPPLRPPRAPRPSSGAGCARTTCRSSRPTTARSASRSRRSSAAGDFSKIPNGLPGVEHRIDLIYQGVVNKEISLGRLGRDRLDHAGQDVRPVPEEGPHRPGQGRRRRRLRPRRDAHDLGVDPPHGRRLLRLRGDRRHRRASTTVLSRGALVVDDGEFVGARGAGKFLTRGLNGFLR